jgi:hypothetical protein
MLVVFACHAYVWLSSLCYFLSCLDLLSKVVLSFHVALFRCICLLAIIVVFDRFACVYSLWLCLLAMLVFTWYAFHFVVMRRLACDACLYLCLFAMMVTFACHACLLCLVAMLMFDCSDYVLFDCNACFFWLSCLCLVVISHMCMLRLAR